MRQVVFGGRSATIEHIRANKSRMTAQFAWLYPSLEPRHALRRHRRSGQSELTQDS